MKTSKDREQQEQVTSSPPVCRTCFEEIQPGAKKCIHCESYQDFRRYINFSNSALALLVALISTATVGIPPLLTAIQQARPNQEKITISVFGSDPNRLTIYASNDGNDFGFLHEEAHFVREGLDHEKCSQNGCQESANIRPRDGGPLPKNGGIPSKTYRLFGVTTNELGWIFQSEGPKDCTLKYSVSSHPNKTRLAEVKFPCPTNKK